MPIVLGLDLETTGTNPDKILEIGCRLWDTDKKMTLKACSLFVNLFEQAEISIPCSNQLNHQITEEQIRKYGYPWKVCVRMLCGFFKEAEYIVAHNAEIGKSFLIQIPELQQYQDKKWIDIMVDVPYPDTMVYRNLEYLGLAHDLFNPDSNQSLSDVGIILGIIDKYDFANIKRLSQEKNIEITCFARAGEDELTAKNLGFRCSSDDNVFIAQVKVSQEESFRKRVQKYLPEAFECTRRLIATISSDQEELAKEQEYRLSKETKKWSKIVLEKDVFMEVTRVKPFFSVQVE